jgi:hypothetical protein
MAGTVIIPWYATGLRAERFEVALTELAAVALRYDAHSYAVYRARDDGYKFQQLASFDDHRDWERYWEGEEMIRFRSRYSGWYQVPVIYGWWDLCTAGGVGEPLISAGERRGNGHGIGVGESA